MPYFCNKVVASWLEVWVAAEYTLYCVDILVLVGSGSFGDLALNWEALLKLR